MFPIVSTFGLWSLKKTLTLVFLNVGIYSNLSVLSTKCENLLIICYHPPELIYHTKATNQPGRQNDSASWHQQSVTDHCKMAHSVTEQGAHCPGTWKPILRHRILRKERTLLQGVNRKEDRRQGSNSSPRSRICSNLYELGRIGWYAEVLVVQVSFGGLWSSVIYSKVVKGPLVQWIFCFWKRPDIQVLVIFRPFGSMGGVKLWLRLLSQNFLLCMCPHCMIYVFALFSLTKKLSILVRNRIGPVWAGFAVAVGSQIQELWGQEWRMWMALTA